MIEKVNNRKFQFVIEYKSINYNYVYVGKCIVATARKEAITRFCEDNNFKAADCKIISEKITPQ